MNKIELKVSYDDFCNWYFDDDTIESTVLDLIAEGTLSIQCIANKVVYLPLSLVQNQDDINEEDIEDDEISDPNDKYRIILTKK